MKDSIKNSINRLQSISRNIRALECDYTGDINGMSYIRHMADDLERIAEQLERGYTELEREFESIDR